MIDECVSLPDVLAANLELRLLSVLSAGVSDVNIDFVLRHRCARRDYRQRLGRAIRVADIAFISDGVSPQLENALSSSVFDESPWDRHAGLAIGREDDFRGFVDDGRFAGGEGSFAVVLGAKVHRLLRDVVFEYVEGLVTRGQRVGHCELLVGEDMRWSLVDVR